jgi:hypothetical protein
MSADGPRDAKLWAIATEVAERHQPEPGGCTCGFCAWSGEHVALMVAGAIERGGAE